MYFRFSEYFLQLACLLKGKGGLLDRSSKTSTKVQSDIFSTLTVVMTGRSSAEKRKCKKYSSVVAPALLFLYLILDLRLKYRFIFLLGKEFADQSRVAVVIMETVI